MSSMKEYEDRKDTINWNRRIRRELRRYKRAKEETNIDDKKDSTIQILDLMYEKACFEYEIDVILLEEEYVKTITLMEGLLTGKVQVNYSKTQEEWNKELMDALQQGRLMRTVGLIKVGKRYGFSRKLSEAEEEQYSKAKQIINRIEMSLEARER